MTRSLRCTPPTLRSTRPASPATASCREGSRADRVGDRRLEAVRWLHRGTCARRSTGRRHQAGGGRGHRSGDSHERRSRNGMGAQRVRGIRGVRRAAGLMRRSYHGRDIEVSWRVAVSPARQRHRRATTDASQGHPTAERAVASHGEVQVTRSDGTVESLPPATLCRCGLSKNKPFCDNSHLDGGFTAAGDRLHISASPVRPHPDLPIDRHEDPRGEPEHN